MAVKWGVAALALFQVTSLCKTFMANRMEANRLLRELKRVELADQGLAHPSATSLVQLAHPKALREEFVAPWELTPLYLRKPDAEINWTERDR